jgi:hypothetical protein
VVISRHEQREATSSLMSRARCRETGQPGRSEAFDHGVAAARQCCHWCGRGITGSGHGMDGMARLPNAQGAFSSDGETEQREGVERREFE